MTLRCPACSANLRVNLDRMGARSSAKCPRCQAQVSLTSAQTPAPAKATATPIIVACPSCQSRLKAPAARAGSRSACPKCHAQILIREAVPLVAPGAVMGAASGSDSEESSNVATRRIDSRMFGMLGLGGSESRSSGVDLDAYVGSRDSSAPANARSVALPEPADEPIGEPGLAASLMRPPVAEMGRIAETIRDTAQRLTGSGGNPKAHAATEGAGPAWPDGSSLPAQATRAEVSPAEQTHASRARGDHSRVEPHHPARRHGASRRLISGGIAGLVIGGASAGAASWQEALPFLSPLPVAGEALGVPDAALRVALPALLGALSGLAAVMWGPASGGRPKRMGLRFAASGLMMGAAFGLASGLATGTAMPVWPIAHWMRDLLLVGLLTPAVNRIIPTSNH